MQDLYEMELSRCEMQIGLCAAIDTRASWLGRWRYVQQLQRPANQRRRFAMFLLGSAEVHVWKGARFLRFRVEPVLPSTLTSCSTEAGLSMGLG